MLIIKHTVQTTAKPEAVWKIWSDVSNWKTWDDSLESSSINGPFVSGTTGKLKMKDSPEFVHTLTNVEPNKTFDCVVKLFCARVISAHMLTQSGNTTLVTNQIEIKGPLALFFAFVIGRGIKKKLPVEMLALIKKAENL